LRYNDATVSNDLVVSAPQGRAFARLEDLARQARGFIEAAKAENSRRAYRSDWRQFEAWCSSQSLACLPATPETVTLYITALAADHKPSSLERKLTSITKAHQAAGFPTPASMQNAVVSETIKGIRRTLGQRNPARSLCLPPTY
jgi:hypothetical protein